jgi:hypothetical protein
MDTGNQWAICTPLIDRSSSSNWWSFTSLPLTIITAAPRRKNGTGIKTIATSVAECHHLWLPVFLESSCGLEGHGFACKLCGLDFSKGESPSVYFNCILDELSGDTKSATVGSTSRRFEPDICKTVAL